MSINSLVNVIEPPRNAAEAKGEWFIVKRELGTSVPDDYKDFINTYGTGRFDNFLNVLNPFSEIDNLNLIVQKEPILNGLIELRDTFSENIPYSLFPAMDGLLPFAETDNGDTLFWQTSGQPNNWTVVVKDSRESEYLEYKENMTSFLAKIFNKEIICDIFPRDFPSPTPVFEPIIP